MTERTPFELATAELRKRGITLRQLPGGYHVNLLGGPDASAETLDEAVQLGRDMAKTFAPATPATTSTATPGKRYRRPRRMTPKAQRRRMIRAHNRRMQARARQRDDQ